MKKAEFLEAYRAELLARYEWAKHPEKLARFMRAVEGTLEGDSLWCKEGDAVVSAWRTIGGKGKPSYKQLRTLK
jgi:hypothetical protein